MPNIKHNIFIFALSWLCSLALPCARAQANPFESALVLPDKDKAKDQFNVKKMKSVQMQADKVNFSTVDNKAIAEGNVVVTAGNEQLTSDRLQIDRAQQVADAQGHVYLESPNQQVDADSAHYNFANGTGKFTNARIAQDPFAIKGENVEKVSDTHYVMDNGYMTTCDHDKPHFRLAMRRMDLYQGDKAVARGVKMYLGNVPIMYLPRYTQDLKDKPWFTFTPGYKKDLGAFLLTQTRIYANDYVKTRLRVDLYERQGIGLGLDNKYNTNGYGNGILRTYFINERQIGQKHPWLAKRSPTIQNERYKVEWRHKWDIDPTTSAIWQYYRLSDSVLMKKYFERESRRDPDLSTYFLLTKVLPHGYVSLRFDRRVNRFQSGTDRIPELTYENSGQEIGDTNVYVKSKNTFSNLIYRAASPTEDRRKTTRFDTNNEVYYPTKVAFVDVRPFVGGEHTYYSRTIDPAHNNSVRGVFRTGVDLSTKFYRMWNIKKNILGIEIDRLRHVVTPSVAYIYQHRPTMPSTLLNQFDSIDSVDRMHKIGLSLENKLQTKRKNKTVDLLRTVVGSDFALKENPGRGGFGPVKSDVEFKPTDWLLFNADAEYDHYNDRVSTFNFDSYLIHDRWSLGVGRRYARDSEDQYTAELSYKINQKWKFKIYERFAVDSGSLKEEDYVLTRDLHEWEMDFIYHQLRGQGSEVLLAFRLKTFPDMGMDLFSTSFNRRKTGSQSTIGS